MSITSLTDQQKAASAAAVAAANVGKSPTSGSNGTLDGDFSFFLKMLTTQLTNQDPTQPMDVSQMTQQIAQYSGVEQQVKTNTNLEKLLASNKQSQMSTAVSYIGREVETSGATGTLQYAQDSAGNAVGQGVFSYFLPSGAQSAAITITNAAGQAVFTGQGTLKNGRNVVVWDGVNSFTGKQMDSGQYTIQVKAKDANGKDIVPETRSVGVVDTVETDSNGNLVLNVGDTQVKFEDILAVREATPFYVPNTSDDTADNSGSGNDTTTGGNT